MNNKPQLIMSSNRKNNLGKALIIVVSLLMMGNVCLLSRSSSAVSPHPTPDVTPSSTFDTLEDALRGVDFWDGIAVMDWRNNKKEEHQHS